MSDDEDIIWPGPHKAEEEELYLRGWRQTAGLIHQPEASIPPGTMMVQDDGDVAVLSGDWAYFCCTRNAGIKRKDSTRGLWE